ncbi:pyrophosphatase PpaX [Clostridium sp. LP20]|uniref:pyrophosphatase PpaX n=1 Tax=Clostridium sp. LP20 TaxID=3418665 RepID=UPI003EE513D6
MIKAVLFDLDGTLLDTNILIYKSFCHTFKEVLNMELPKAEITRLYGKPLNYSFANYTDKEEVIEKMIDTYRSYNAEYHDNMCKPFEGVVELLQTLINKGIKMGIVTSKRKTVAVRGMEIGGIIEFMDVIISPELTEKHKPEAEPALKACELLGIKPEEAIMVGDSPYDLLCGKSAGCITCGVEYTALEIEELLKVEPNHMLKSPLDILELL